jgi:hypothetical protein
MTVNAGYGESRKSWRHFRTEMHVEAAHNPELAEYMSEGFDTATKFLSESFTAFGAPAEFADVMAWFLHPHAIGIAIIHSLLPQVADHDNRIMGRWVVQQLLNR